VERSGMVKWILEKDQVSQCALQSIRPCFEHSNLSQVSAYIFKWLVFYNIMFLQQTKILKWCNFCCMVISNNALKFCMFHVYQDTTSSHPSPHPIFKARSAQLAMQTSAVNQVVLVII
jgi:hypothetical protein